ncbi:ABC transporter permease subunit [candidate division WOR-3 bacterium]|nr:ABC transporter permease subunit [candidate division WOR-3 bacterium]
MEKLYYFKAIYKMFLAPGFRRTRTRVFILLNVFPLMIVVAVKIYSLFQGQALTYELSFFKGFAYLFYVSFYSPVVAVFFGSSLIREDIEDKTLVFLTSRPVPKKDIFMGKFFSLLTIVLFSVIPGYILCFLTMFFNHLLNAGVLLIFFNFTLGISLALLAYFAVFSLLSLLASKSTAIGLVFIFGWEGIVQFIPGMTQKLTIIYHVRSILPSLGNGGGGGLFSNPITRENPVTAFFVISLVVLFSIASSIIILGRKRYVL